MFELRVVLREGLGQGEGLEAPFILPPPPRVLAGVLPSQEQTTAPGEPRGCGQQSLHAVPAALGGAQEWVAVRAGRRASSEGRGCQGGRPEQRCRKGRATPPPSSSTLSVGHGQGETCEPKSAIRLGRKVHLSGLPQSVLLIPVGALSPLETQGGTAWGQPRVAVRWLRKRRWLQS